MLRVDFPLPAGTRPAGARRIAAGRAHAGRMAHLGGLAAEDGVARAYAAQGAQIVARRWRGRSGEIDLILRDGVEYVFVEVKQAATCAQAAERLGARQAARMCRAAEEFLGGTDDGGAAAMRFDVALVDGSGRIDVHRGVFFDV